MDLLEKASIILTPTASNNGEALCVKPSDGSGDFDFSRNSAATRVNAQGLVENVQILSSNLVQNGDFSEEGVQEVSNGSFSQEGVELVTNGSFDTDSNWNGVGSNGVDISNGSLNYSETPNGTNITQGGVVEIGKSYKVTFTISNYVKGGILVVLGAGGTTQEISANGTFTIYGVASINTTLYIQARGASGTTLSIDNVSVKEVGQDWTLGTGWSIGEDKATFDETIGGAGNLNQSNILTVGKTYKLTFDTLETNGGNLAYAFGNNSVFINNIQADTTHVVYGVADDVFLKIRGASNFNGSITNISVKEVGQNWTLSGVDFSLGSVFFDNANDNIFQGGGYFSSGTKYKLTFEGSGNLAYRTGFAGADGTRKQITLPHTAYLTATADTNRIQAYGADGDLEGTLTNISIIEITDDTNLPRINYEGFSYQDALGSELVTNGDFSNGTAWTLSGGATISDGKANIVGDGSVFTNISQGGVFTNGKQYVVKLDVIINSGLGLKFQDGANNENIGFATTSGTYTFNFTATSNSYILIGRRTGGTPFNSSIDNVSVKEYLGQEPIPNSGCGSWLWEPQSTNLITYSSDFSDASWFKGNTSVIANQELSPSGIQDADKVTFLAVPNANIQLTSAIATTIGEDYTYSIYAKADTNVNNVKFGGGIGGDVDLAITDSWQRFSVTFTATSTTTVTTLVTRDAALSNIYLWGAQVEQQSYATSYIPTSGATVTRNQDLCTNGGSLASINSTEGVLYAEIAALADDGTIRYITISDGTTNNILSITFFNDSTITSRITIGGTNRYLVSGVITQTDNFKVALKWGLNNYALWVNGVEVQANNSLEVFAPDTMSTLDFKRASNSFYGKTKAVAVWKEALSDSELQSLTTI